MKTFLAAYAADRDAQQWNIAFSVMVTDEAKTITALRALAYAQPSLRWTQRDGGLLGSKQVAPKSPFNFLRSAV
jgi:hypothetical protein